MTEDQQKSRLDSLIGIVRAFFRIDPMIALIAILIIVPLSIPIINAILGGETEVVTTFVLFIAGITLFVYIPLIVVRTWKDKEKDFTENRKEAINKELESRLETKKKASERADQVVLAKIEVLQAQTKAIIENIPNFERILLQQEADKIRESLGLEITDEASLLTRLGLVIESFEVIIKKFDNLESLVPGLQQTIEEINKQFVEEVSESDKVTPLISREDMTKQILSMAEMIGELEMKLAEKDAEFANDNPEILASNLPEAGTSGLITADPADFSKSEHLPFKPEFAEKMMEEEDKPTIPERIKEVFSVGKSKILGDKKVIDDMEIYEVSVMPDEKGELPDAFKEALEVVDKMEDTDPLVVVDPSLNSELYQPEPIPDNSHRQTLAPASYWLCSHCGNKNALKKVRCRQCHKGKKIV